MTTRRRVLTAVALWAAVVAAFLIYQRDSDQGTVELAQRLVDAAKGNWWAIAAFAVVSALRPVVLFPATILTIAAGVLFGAVVGVAVAAVGANGSALIAYNIGRTLRRPVAGTPGDDERVSVWTQRLHSNGFEAVLLMRLLFLPYDVVSYACGLLRVPRREFLVANAIGTLPGTVAFVLIGASIERLEDGLRGIDPVTLTISIVLVVASLIGSRILRRRSPVNSPPTE